MWGVLVILAVGSCSVSAEHYKLKTVALPPFESQNPATTPVVDSRIIGGSPTTIQKYPYAVQVLYSNQLACGGSLLTSRHVLSAAHCFVDTRGVLQAASLFTCRVGTATLNTGGTTHRVSMIINHERYNVGWARDNDISVLLLATAVTLGAADTAAIPSQGGAVPYNAMVWVIGWGRTNANINQASTTLNEVAVYTVNTTVCGERYRVLELIRGDAYPVTDNMLCSGLLDIGGRDACQGDSGGPVVYAGIVVGVTSWGEGCANATYPGVNTRVSAYTTWISTAINRYNGAPSVGHASVALLVLSFLATAVLSEL